MMQSAIGRMHWIIWPYEAPNNTIGLKGLIALESSKSIVGYFEVWDSLSIKNFLSSEKNVFRLCEAGAIQERG